MAAVGRPLSRSPFQGESHGYPSHVKNLPILPSAAAHPSSTDAMEISQPHHAQTAPSGPMGPPTVQVSNGDRPAEESSSTHPEQQSGHPPQQQQPQQGHPSTNGPGSQPVGAAAAAQQPKVVQTAFIHKLYNMLEDQSIQHLISWSSTNESFVMSPSSEFSKVLAQYFKHTNISSFVRQLNMYGFHKVSDVFHTGSPDAPLWEFKHGAGNFKRGDLVGLREIKRRASRHALIHRDSFPTSAQKMPAPPQGSTPVEHMQDPVEARLSMLEWNQQDMYTRMARTEEAYSAMAAKCQTLLEGLTKCHHWNHELSNHLLTLVPDPDNPVHRDVYAMRQDISRQVDQLRAAGEPQDSMFGRKQSYFQNSAMPMEPSLPVSPRQRPFDESRRPSLQTTGRPNSFRAGVPSHLQVSPRRYGSIGSGNNAYSPTTRNYPPPPPPPQPPQAHPLSQMSSPPGSLARRHTSADIRVHGWQGHQPSHYASSPYASGQNSSAWPSSPHVAPNNPADQHLRDSLAQYELPRPSPHPHHPGGAGGPSKPSSPPPPPLPPHQQHYDPGCGPPSSFHNNNTNTNNSTFGSYANPNDAGWQLPGARYAFKSGGGGGGLETPGTDTRRSSMASNVHSLLNPADTAEREGEDEAGPGPEERNKRKRVQ